MLTVLAVALSIGLAVIMTLELAGAVYPNGGRPANVLPCSSPF